MDILTAIRNEDLEYLASLKDSDDPDILRCKVVALIKLERYHDALNLCTSIGDGGLNFEYAYSLYRTGQLDKAFIACQYDQDNFNHLKAMLLYRLERFNDAIKLYSRLDQFQDVETNKSACIALQGLEQTNKATSFASLFNRACFYAKQQKYQLAIDTLVEAESFNN